MGCKSLLLDSHTINDLLIHENVREEGGGGDDENLHHHGNNPNEGGEGGLNGGGRSKSLDIRWGYYG